MAVRTRKRTPEIVLSGGKPTAVIVDIDDYEELLERAEDAKDLAILRKMRTRPLHFRRLSEFLKEHARHV